MSTAVFMDKKKFTGLGDVLYYLIIYMYLNTIEYIISAY